MAASRWRIRVLGGLGADDGEQSIERFGSGSVAALLARLAMYPARRHSREELLELLWPGVDVDTGRNRLRQTLFALRALLEPPSAVPRPVIVADRASIGVVEGALDCDAIEFERAVRAGRHGDALALYRGELLPGHYDEWIDEERLRLAALAERAEAALARSGTAPHAPGPAAFSPPAVARRERSSLPLYLTRFFGREAEIARLRDALSGHRLVTLLGPGGGGKTRLAAEACAGLRDGAGRGELTLFVPVVGCSSAAALVDALAAALRLAPAEGDALARIVDALEARPTLLVLDNFEQLVDSGGAVVATLLAALPGLRILVTSRRALGLDGERQLAIAPLALPTADAALADAAASPALGLFVDRARAARADFHLSERNRNTLIELVAALEGLPLALELAASRVRSISPAEMLEHLRPAAGGPRGAALALLARSGVRAGGDPRHASMLRTIEWSWQLLSPPLQRLLAELTVFEGGFTPQAAVAVGSGSDQAPVVVMLDELVGHSLLAVLRSEDDDDAGTPTRFALDESIRAFAATMLDPAALPALRARHRRWLADWGRSLPPTPPLALLRAELRNVDAALASAHADGAGSEGVAVMVALRRGLPDIAVPASLLPLFEADLGQTADAALASRGLTLLGRLHLAAGGTAAARDHVARGLALARGLGADVPGRDELLARALHTAASVVWRTLRDAAASEALLDEAEPLAARSGDLGAQASVHALRAFIANVAHRDLGRAEALHGRALELWERAGDATSANNGRYNLAVCALRAGRLDEVLSRLDDVARQAGRQHDWRLLSQAKNVAGEALLKRRDWPAAAAAYRDSLELAWSALAQPSFAYALWNLPYPLARQRRPEAAARLGGAAQRFWEAHMGALDGNDRRDLRRLQRLVAAQVGPGRTAALWKEGASLALPEVVALALAPPMQAPMEGKRTA